MTTSAPGIVGKADRVIRVVLGLVLIGFALACPWAASLGPLAQWVAGIAGGILVTTAATGLCPLYRLLGICTG